jgi:predicted nucleic acid-binding protein
MHVLDTDVLIDVQRKHAAAVAWFSSLGSLPSVPGLVVMELIREALKLVAPLPILWPTHTDCQRALNDFAAFHLSHSLGLLDALIAPAPLASTRSSVPSTKSIITPFRAS